MSAHPDTNGLDWGRHRVACPRCDRGPSDRALSLLVDSDGVTWHCFRCDWSGRSTHAGAVTRAPKSVSPRQVAQAPRERLSGNGLALWRSCSRIGGEARAYLVARGCAIPPADGALRWHPQLPHPSGHAGPALVALVTDALTGEPRTLHRTWVCADGRKAGVSPPRMLLGGHRKAGGVIRLWPDEAVAGGLAVAEGIETALTAGRAFTPVWAAIDAGNLGALPVLAGIEEIVLIVDNDPAGRRAGIACAARWCAAGRVARWVMPPERGTDLNDLGCAA